MILKTKKKWLKQSMGTKKFNVTTVQWPVDWQDRDPQLQVCTQVSRMLLMILRLGLWTCTSSSRLPGFGLSELTENLTFEQELKEVSVWRFLFCYVVFDSYLEPKRPLNSVAVAATNADGRVSISSTTAAQCVLSFEDGATLKGCMVTLLLVYVVTDAAKHIWWISSIFLFLLDSLTDWK